MLQHTVRIPEDDLSNSPLPSMSLAVSRIFSSSYNFLLSFLCFAVALANSVLYTSKKNNFKYRNYTNTVFGFCLFFVCMTLFGLTEMVMLNCNFSELFW
jgi:hypothetical protein